jgi:hypothetical protein
MLLPDVSLVVFAAALLHVLFLSGGAWGLFRDSDTGWHIRNGEAIVRTLAAPSTDSFSYTRAGQPWFAWEWLSDAVFGEAYRFGGLAAVAFIASLAIAFAAWGAVRLALSLGANLFAAVAAVVVLLGVTSIHWLARPHVFSWLLALVFVSVAEHARRGRLQGLYGLPVLACLWANVHGSFLLGPAILLIYGIVEPVPAIRTRTMAAGLFTLLATFVNPYGWRLHEHVFTYLQDSYLMDHISEFRSFSFHSPGAWYVEAFLFMTVAAIIAFLRQRAFGPALLAVALLHISLYSARHLATAAVLLLPLAAAALTREAESFRRLRPLLDYSNRLRAIDRRIVGIVPAILVLIAAFAGVTTLARRGSVGFSPRIFPVRAVEFLEANNVEGRIFARDQWGGYLIFRSAGQSKVFIDGRSDFYGRQFLETYAQVADVKAQWSTVLKQYDVELVLIPPEHALASVLALSPEWRRIYSDPVAAIFQKVG